MRSVGRYDVVTHAYSIFTDVSLGALWTIAPKSVEFPKVEIGEVIAADGS